MRARFFTLLLSSTIATGICGVFGSFCISQEASPESLAVSPSRYHAILEDVEVGISTGNVALLSRHFGSQVAIDLRGSESGTFSSNQSYYVLQNFFKVRRFGRFAFSTFGESDVNPYATGNVEFIYKGTKEIAQVYVALTLAGDRYAITQLTVY